MNVVDEARRWLGYLEHQDCRLLGVYTANPGKGGYTIFAQMVGLPQGLPWCATFIHAVYSATVGAKQTKKFLGKPHPGSRKLQRVTKLKKLWRSNNYTPMPGDIIFLSPLNNGIIGHCGIVVSTTKDSVISIDGNTVDPSGHFDPKDGGAVAIRTRKLQDSVIVGYANMQGLSHGN